jgi:hypothetical protein
MGSSYDVIGDPVLYQHLFYYGWFGLLQIVMDGIIFVSKL